MSFFNLTALGPNNAISANKISVDKTDSAANGSHGKFEELRTKHTRKEKGPTEQYVNPIATSQDYGWQQVSEGIPAWAKNARHAHVNSEMTRFVDDMSKTNKDFKLF